MTTEPMIPSLDEIVREAMYGEDQNSTLARAIVELFGEAQPCGQIEPEVYPGEVIITREMVGRYTPREALAAAVAIIRGAIQAQEQKP